MLDQETVINMVKQYANIVAKELSPAAIVLFGSYARGNARDDSDIDVAVIFNGFTGNWHETSSMLWRLRRDISYDIEPVLLDSAEDKSGFVKNIYKTGQIIFNTKAS